MKSSALSIPVFFALVGCGELLPVVSSWATNADGGDAFASALAAGSDGGDARPAIARDGGVDADADAAFPAPYIFIPSPRAPSFVDDFERADGPIGNGWALKTPAAFSIASGGVREDLEGVGWNLLVQRPTAENALDVEVSASFTFASGLDDPSLYARLQPESDQPDRFVGYRLRIGATLIELTLGYSGGVQPLAKENLLPSLVVGRSYRLYLRTSGTDPVVVQAAVGLSDGTIFRSVLAESASANRIVIPGRTAFSSSSKSGCRWDDFRMIGF